MLRIEDFVALAKEGDVIDDHTDKPVQFGKIMGFCLLKNNDIGILLNAKHYQIVQAYIGEDKLVHMSEWPICGIVSKEKMDTVKGVTAFNTITKRKTWAIRKAIMLNGDIINL